MALDTSAKRMNALRCANLWTRTLPIPDGTIAAADRSHLLGFFGAATADVGAFTPLERFTFGADNSYLILGPDG